MHRRPGQQRRVILVRPLPRTPTRPLRAGTRTLSRGREGLGGGGGGAEYVPEAEGLVGGGGDNGGAVGRLGWGVVGGGGVGDEWV
jgi:hypothetical protein